MRGTVLRILAGIGAGCVLACSADLTVPEGTAIRCATSADCPPERVCGPRQRCITPEQAALGGGAPGIDVTADSGNETTELGGSTTFTVQLTGAPVADVTIGITSDDTSEGTVSPAVLTFTPSDWNRAQTVTVTGVHDCDADGNATYNAVLAPALSEDDAYAEMDPPDVALVNRGAPPAAIVVSPGSGLLTSESGNTDTFTVVLACRPRADVVIGVQSGNPSEGQVDSPTLVFTGTNWDQNQTVTVTGQHDCDFDGDLPYGIELAPATSADPAYDGIDPSDVGATNTDSPSAAITVMPTSGLSTTEVGGTDSFSVSLGCAPSADVSIDLSVDMPNEGTVEPSVLVFPVASWSMPRVAIVTGLDDNVDDGDQVYTVVTGDAVSADLAYDGLAVDDVTATNTDNDNAFIFVNNFAFLETDENSRQAYMTIELTAAPTMGAVMVPVAVNPTSEATVATAVHSFNAANWATPQNIFVTGVDDLIDDGDVDFTVEIGPATSLDPAFDGLDPNDYPGRNYDNDTAGITISKQKVYTRETGTTDQIVVRLDTRPTDPVQLTFQSSAPSEASLTFGVLNVVPAAWATPLGVIVTGQDDGVAGDGVGAFTVSLVDVTSMDPVYDGFTVPDIAGFNLETSKRMFLTAATFDGAGVGSVAAADATCSTDANKPPGTYAALLVDGSTRVACTTGNCSGGLGEHVGWVLAPNTTYTWDDNATLVGTTNHRGLFSFPLINGVADTITAPVDYWTGLLADWTTGPTCAGGGAWGSASGGVSGGRGSFDRTQPEAIAMEPGGAPCDVARRLWCVEQ